MNTEELEQRLRAAQERVRRATEAATRKHVGGEMEEWDAAKEALLGIERDLAAARGEEHAVPLDFPLKWDIGAPSPHLLVNDAIAFLAFYLRTVDPNWDGTYVRVRNPETDRQPIALVTFYHYRAAKLGDPNDEVLEGHRLSGKGLDMYTAQKVENSVWIAELQAINSVHDYYSAELSKNVNHYVFWFHDTTFECIAESYDSEVIDGTMPEVLSIACDRLVKGSYLPPENRADDPPR